MVRKARSSTNGSPREFFPQADPIGRRIRLGASGGQVHDRRYRSTRTWFTINRVARGSRNGPAHSFVRWSTRALEAEPAPEGRAAIMVKGPARGGERAVTRRGTRDGFHAAAFRHRDARGGARPWTLPYPHDQHVVWRTRAWSPWRSRAVGVFAHDGPCGVRSARTRLACGWRLAPTPAPSCDCLRDARSLQLGIGMHVRSCRRSRHRTTHVGASAADPLTLLIVTTLLTGVAMTATLVPARRAARVDPMVALRAE